MEADFAMHLTGCDGMIQDHQSGASSYGSYVLLHALVVLLRQFFRGKGDISSVGGRHWLCAELTVKVCCHQGSSLHPAVRSWGVWFQQLGGWRVVAQRPEIVPRSIAPQPEKQASLEKVKNSIWDTSMFLSCPVILSPQLPGDPHSAEIA